MEEEFEVDAAFGDKDLRCANLNEKTIKNALHNCSAKMF